jgi:hypothetical protein
MARVGRGFRAPPAILGVPAAAPKAAALSDNFDDGTVAPIWQVYGSAGTSYSETGGVFQIQTGTSSGYVDVVAGAAYDLYESELTVELVRVDDSATTGEVYLIASGDGGGSGRAPQQNTLSAYWSGGNLFAFLYTAGTRSTLASSAIALPRFLRLAIASGTLLVQHAATYGSWTTLYSGSPPANVRFDGIVPWFGYGSFSTTNFTGQLDNFNLAPVVIPGPSTRPYIVGRPRLRPRRRALVEIHAPLEAPVAPPDLLVGRIVQLSGGRRAVLRRPRHTVRAGPPIATVDEGARLLQRAIVLARRIRRPRGRAVVERAALEPPAVDPGELVARLLVSAADRARDLIPRRRRTQIHGAPIEGVAADPGELVTRRILVAADRLRDLVPRRRRTQIRRAPADGVVDPGILVARSQVARQPVRPRYLRRVRKLWRKPQLLEGVYVPPPPPGRACITSSEELLTTATATATLLAGAATGAAVLTACTVTVTETGVSVPSQSLRTTAACTEAVC